jgi:hypothetical protein
MICRFSSCFLLTLVLWSGAGSAQLHSLPPVIDVSAVDKDTYVSFYWFSGDYAHPLLIFRVAAKQSAKWNTAPIMDHQGRTAFITLNEMRALVAKINELDPAWFPAKRNSPGVPSLREVTSNLEITIYGAKGDPYSRRENALAALGPAKLCPDLASLDSALTTPRALWEFQLYRADYQCTVPGFERGLYLDHDFPTLSPRPSR